MQVQTVSSEERARYDEFVASRLDGDALQSWAWGEVKRSSGWVPLRFMVTEGDEILASCQVLKLVPMRGVPPILYAPRGPVVAREDAIKPLLEAIEDRAGNAYLFTCDPPVTEANALTNAGLRKVVGAGFGGVQPKAVMTLDLTPGADEVFAGFKSKWRYNCRLAERKGIKIREGSREDLSAWYQVLVETATRDKFLVRGLAYFETIWDHLGDAGMLRLLLAEHEGDLIAGILCFKFGKRITYVYGASSNTKRDLMPNHLLQWTAIRDAASEGLEVYDFRGVSPVRNGQPTEPHIAGLNRFKEGFGAEYVEYVGTLDMPLRRSWYWAWTNLAPRVLEFRRKRAGGVGSAAD